MTEIDTIPAAPATAPVAPAPQPAEEPGTETVTAGAVVTDVPSKHADQRMCFGMALLVDSSTDKSWRQLGKQLFVPEGCVKWLTLVDVPKGYFCDNPGRGKAVTRPVHWVALRSVSVEDVGLVLGGELEGHDVLDPEHRFTDGDRERMMRLVPRMEVGMTEAAYSCNKRWGLAAPDKVGRPPSPPVRWMPRAYVAFDATVVPSLFHVATQEESRSYPEAMKRSFVEAMGDFLEYRPSFDGRVVSIDREAGVEGEAPEVVVTLHNKQTRQYELVRFTKWASLPRQSKTFKAGEPLGCERFHLPAEWFRISVKARWESHVEPVLGSIPIGQMMRLWFDRQGIEVTDKAPQPGLPLIDPRAFGVGGDVSEEGPEEGVPQKLIHVPAALVAGTPAMKLAAPGQPLLWDVGPAHRYFDEECESFVFPPIRIDRFSDLSGLLSGGLWYDVSPETPRYRPSGVQTRRTI